jgi:glutamyl-tRNA synthetase
VTYVGRLAPSPTGAQHFGNARTFLIAWMVCRLAQGRLLLRIEDLDTPRTKQGAAEQAIEDLKWLGLDWDDVASDTPYTTQSDREARYTAVLNQLKNLGCIYPCTCSRSEIERAASAPHESVLDGTVYPGTCSARDPAESQELVERGVEFAWRFRMPAGVHSFHDEKYGPQSLDAKEKLGDFIVARSSGVTAYQLAVVVDDHDFGINHVVRGNDLIYSTYRQLAIYNTLDWEPPAWLHLPLVVGLDGRRLAKRHGDTRLSFYREQGVAPEQILGRIAVTIGLISELKPISAADLLAISKFKPEWLMDSPIAPVLFDGKIEPISKD